MYDELIAALRGPYNSMTDIQIKKQAADAIEELCGLCASQSKDCSEAVAKYLELWTKQPRWIPVTERLPEERKDVLVALRRGEIAVDYYQPNRWGYSDVTHWMPLPEPPKEAYDEN